MKSSFLDSLFNLFLVKTMVEDSSMKYIYIYAKWQWQKGVFTMWQQASYVMNCRRNTPDSFNFWCCFKDGYVITILYSK